MSKAPTPTDHATTVTDKKPPADAPTVGRIVHVYEGESGPFAALVTGVRDDGKVELFVFPVGEMPRPVSKVGSEKSDARAYWAWPPRPQAATDRAAARDAEAAKDERDERDALQP